MIWIVEQKNKLGLWAPTVGAGLTRKEAKREMEQYWLVNYPDEKFRVKKYISAY